MGKVFSFEQVAANQVPAPGEHREAASFIIAELFNSEHVNTSHNEGSPNATVESGMIFGSVALGTENVRSDLDVYVNYDGSRGPEALGRIGVAVVNTEKKFRVPVGVTTLHIGALNNPSEHRVDLGLARHLRHVEGVVDPDLIHGNPVHENIVEIAAKRPAKEYAIEYLASKMRSFSRAAAHPNELDLNTMQLAFELPDAACRKVLLAMWSEERDGLMPADEDKGFVFGLTAETLQKATGNGSLAPELWEMMRQLSAMNHEYTLVLQDVTNDKVSIGCYEQWINGHYLEACYLAHDVAHNWVATLRGLDSHQQIQR